MIAERAERSAVLLTTNLPFSEWTQVIPNARLCKAVLDRITDRAHIIETNIRGAAPDDVQIAQTVAFDKQGRTRCERAPIKATDYRCKLLVAYPIEEGEALIG